jgi:hypothetical protein
MMEAIDSLELEHPADRLRELQMAIYGTYPPPNYAATNPRHAEGQVAIVVAQVDRPAIFDARGRPA